WARLCFQPTMWLAPFSMLMNSPRACAYAKSFWLQPNSRHEKGRFKRPFLFLILSSASAALSPARGCSTLLLEQRGELLRHRACQFFRINDGDSTLIIARDIMADTDCNQLHRRACFDLFNHGAQMAFEIVARIDGKRRIVDGSAVRDHHQDLALLGTRKQPLMRPAQRHTVDKIGRASRRDT